MALVALVQTNDLPRLTNEEVVCLVTTVPPEMYKAIGSTINTYLTTIFTLYNPIPLRI